MDACITNHFDDHCIYRIDFSDDRYCHQILPHGFKALNYYVKQNNRVFDKKQIYHWPDDAGPNSLGNMERYAITH